MDWKGYYLENEKMRFPFSENLVNIFQGPFCRGKVVEDEHWRDEIKLINCFNKFVLISIVYTILKW